MAIVYNENLRTFKLDTNVSSYIVKVYDEGYLLNLYYGAYIPDADVPLRCTRSRNASFSPTNPVIGEGFSPDSAPMEYGVNGAGDFRASALSVRNADGNSVTDIRYESYSIYPGKPSIPNMPSTYECESGDAETLEIRARDSATGILVTLYYSVFESMGVMTRWVRVENTSERACRLERAFSLCVDFPTMDYDFITLPGRYCKERNVERRPLCHGLQGVESKRGVSGHVQNPFAALAERGAGEENGWCYGFNLVYSGNFSLMAECDFNDSTRLLMGIHPVDFAWNLAKGETFDTPEAVMVFSPNGVGAMSRAFHRFYSRNLIRGRWKTEKRPILINSWEAAYFDFDTEKLVEFAREAKKLGIEMLVMDDGWFGKRNGDSSSLGDWYVNEDKLQGGLGRLIDLVHAEGMKFGIWYEPEMVSPDSDLFRAHPDWHVHVEGREPLQGRRQYVLDVSRADVRDNIWGQMNDVLSKYPIDYVKWDFNRNITDAASALLPPDKQTEFFHRFILGTYDLMNRMVTAYPNILFENCSGGGGRYDPAMLSYSPQIWASDNTDAIERLSIQFGTSMCYPASTMGAHVSANRRTDIVTRCRVAMWGTFGYELDPRKLTEEEKEIVRSQVKEYHRYYDLIHTGDLYRLIAPSDNPYRAAWEIAAEDRSSALFTMVTIRRECDKHLIVKLRGLDPNAVYVCPEFGYSCSGAMLMNAGLVLDGIAEREGSSVQMYFQRA